MYIYRYLRIETVYDGRRKNKQKTLNTFILMHTYIYIHMYYTYTLVYVQIYTHIHTYTLMNTHTHLYRNLKRYVYCDKRYMILGEKIV